MKPFQTIRTCLGLATASMVATLALTGIAVAQDFSRIEIKAEKLNETTWMLVGAGGNMGLSVGEDAVFLVDDQYAPMAPKISAGAAIDTTGAGDAFNGAFAAALADGADAAHAVIRGCAAGALCVTRAGTSVAMPHAHEIDALVSAHSA
jgi:sugar/nucleoside kinase (ribokinase family)